MIEKIDLASVRIGIIGLGYVELPLAVEFGKRFPVVGFDIKQDRTYDAIVLAVAHPEFLQWGANGIHALGKPGHVLYDVKSLLPKGAADGRL